MTYKAQQYKDKSGIKNEQTCKLQYSSKVQIKKKKHQKTKTTIRKTKQQKTLNKTRRFEEKDKIINSQTSINILINGRLMITLTNGPTSIPYKQIVLFLFDLFCQTDRQRPHMKIQISANYYKSSTWLYYHKTLASYYLKICQQIAKPP